MNQIYYANPTTTQQKVYAVLFWKINFVRRFVPDFVEIVKPLQQMIKKDVQFKWTSVEKEAFENIKATIVAAPLFKVHILLKTSCCILLLLTILLQQCSLKRTNKGMSAP
jgi:hypothetical protein